MTPDQIVQLAQDLASQSGVFSANTHGAATNSDTNPFNLNVSAPTLSAQGESPSLYGLAGIDPKQVFQDPVQARIALAQIQKYDPNASIVDQNGTPMDLSGKGGQFQGGGDSTFTIQFDPSKLPAMPKTASGAGAANFGTSNLYDTSNVAYDPNYGPITSQSNIKQDHSGDWLSTLAPMLIGGLASLAGGGLTAGLLTRAPGAIGAAAGGNFSGLENAALSVGTGALGLPSWLTSGATTLARLAKGRGG